MNKQVSLLFALLRNALFLQPFNIDDWKNVDWAELYKLIKSHALQTLVAEPVMMLPAELRPSAQIQSELLQLMAMNMAEHARLNADICKVFQLLTERGFHPVLLKGQGIATFYPKPLARKCGDVDIYIGEKDYDAACKFLINDVEGTTGKHESEKHYEIFYGKTELEIHRYSDVATPPQNNNNYQSLVASYFAKPDFVEIGEQKIPIPPAQFDVVYVFYHMFHHFKLRGVGLRQFCDVAVLLHQLNEKIDLLRMKEDLMDINMLDEWQLLGPIFVKCFGLSKEEYPFYRDVGDDKIKKIIDLVIKDGNFAKTAGFSYKTNSRILYKIHSLYAHSLRYWRMAQLSFPLAINVYWFILKRGVKAVLSGKDK